MDDLGEFKICNRNDCILNGAKQPLDQFMYHNRVCRTCRNADRKKRRQELSAIWKNADPFDGTMKECSRPYCKQPHKPRIKGNWHRSSGEKDGLRPVCLPCENETVNTCLLQHRAGAVSRDLPDPMSDDELVEIMVLPCVYKSEHNGEDYWDSLDTLTNTKHNGLDRLDNRKGYTPENTIPCCFACNTKKGAITLGMVMEINRQIMKRYGAKAKLKIVK